MTSSQATPGPEPFGKYLLDREIARGGMARVHLARLRGLGGFEKRLVVKQILPHLARDPRFVSMFVEEAKTVVQMSHPHVVPVYELGVVDGVYFLAMEYVEGATLADVLEDGTLDPAQAAHVGAQVCDALSYAHERFSVVHRDVTPKNVMIDAAGHCRLLDFGIAAPAEDDPDGALFGTPGYLAPEQARGDAIGPASDLFGVGAVLHHALTGEPPLPAHDVEAARQRRAPIPSLAERGVDRQLAAIVDRALAIDPRDRPASARALARSLREWLAARRPEGVGPDLGARAERARTRRDRRRASERPPAQHESTRREPTGNVRTLAQSRALEEIIEGTAPIARDARSAEDGTVRVDRRARDAERAPELASASGDEGPATRPITPAAAPEPSAPAQRSRAREAPRSWVGPVMVGSLALAFAIVLALAAGEPERAPVRERASVAAPAPLPAPAPAPAPPPASAPASAPTPERHAETPPASAPPVAPPSPTEAPRSASLAVSSRDWAEIAIDGRRVGTTPIRRASISAGAHTLVAENAPLGLRASATFEATPGQRLRAIVDFRATPPQILVAPQ